MYLPRGLPAQQRADHSSITLIYPGHGVPSTQTLRYKVAD